MATVVFTGQQQARAQVGTLVITNANIGDSITVTINRKDIAFTPTTAVEADLAAGLYALLAASAEGEFAEITWSYDSSVTITFTGPADGAPITVTKTDAGASTSTLTLAATAAKSPHDFNDAENFLGGALPANGDTVVFENSDVAVKYNLSALTATTFLVVRRKTHTGAIGLPDTNPNGYREYRATHLEFAGVGTAIQCEQSDRDQAGAVRLKSTAATAVTATVTGPGGRGQVLGEVFEITGMPASSTLSVGGSSVAVAPVQGQTCTATTVRCIDGSVRLGTGVTTTTVNLTNSDGLVRCAYTTLTLDRGGDVEVTNAATGTTNQTDEGTIKWTSTGALGTFVLGSAGVLDLTESPAAVTMTAIEMLEGSSLLDPAGRITTPAIDFTRCGPQDVTLDLGSHFKLTRSAHS
jgi:hypothetical protein